MRLVRSPLLKQTAPCLGHAVQLTTAKPLPHVVFHVLYFLALLLSTAFLIPSLTCSCCHKALYYYPLAPPTASPPALLYYQTIVPFTCFIQAITTSAAGSVPPSIFFGPRCRLCAVMYIQLVLKYLNIISFIRHQTTYKGVDISNTSVYSCSGLVPWEIWQTDSLFGLFKVKLVKIERHNRRT